MKGPTEEEHQLVKDYVLVKLVLAMLERDRRIVSNAPLKTKGPYISVFDRAWGMAKQDLLERKRMLRRNGIQIRQEKQVEKGVWEYYYCHGREEIDAFLWDCLRRQAEAKLSFYLSTGRETLQR